MKNITILIPAFVNNETDEKFLKNAVESAKSLDENEGKILVIGRKEDLKSVEDDKRVTCIENEGDTDFCSQIELGLSKCRTEYFSILEMDDTYMKNWFTMFERYRKYVPDVSAYIPLNEAYDFNNLENGPVGYINEAIWASSFSDEIGYIDLECAKNFLNFNLTGAIFNRKDFNDAGGLKKSMKLSFWYEFLLRFLNNEKKAYVIPKVGYNHLFGRPGCVAEQYHKEMDQDEADWWIDLAQKEYIYKKDRNKEYEK